MNTLDKQELLNLIENSEKPCLSLYQPTHRAYPQHEQDSIRYKNLLKELEESLRQKYPDREFQPLLEPFRKLGQDRNFWTHARDGLAVLGSPDVFRFFTLQRPVPELAVAADSFHIKPLIRILQSADRYQVLGVSRDSFRLFEGNRDVLDEIEPHDSIPRTMTAALGKETTDEHHTVASYGGAQDPHSPMHHGHGGKKADIDIDTERFFRAVDAGVFEHHSKPTQLPVILAALPEHHALFHHISTNQFLLEKGLDFFPEKHMSLDDIRTRVWKFLEPRVIKRLNIITNQFVEARPKDNGHDDPSEIAKAAVAGRIDTLLIEADRQIPGRIDTANGEIELDHLEHPETDDILDDIGEIALKKGGEVIVVPKERMPTGTGIAAVYRY